MWSHLSLLTVMANFSYIPHIVMYVHKSTIPPLLLHNSLVMSSECEGYWPMCLGTLVTRRLCSEGTKRFIRVYFVLRQRFTMLRGHWCIIVLREHSGISAGIPFGQPQVVVDWETVIWRLSFFPSTPFWVLFTSSYWTYFHRKWWLQKEDFTASAPCIPAIELWALLFVVTTFYENMFSNCY